MQLLLPSTGNKEVELSRSEDFSIIEFSCFIYGAHPTVFLFCVAEDVIVNFPLSNKDADERFGAGGYKVVDLPSEKGKNLAKNYLRYVPDPSTK
jgi:hypothetical protein